MSMWVWHSKGRIYKPVSVSYLHRRSRPTATTFAVGPETKLCNHMRCGVHTQAPPSFSTGRPPAFRTTRPAVAHVT